MKMRRNPVLVVILVLLGLAVLAAAAVAFILQPGPIVLAGKGHSLGKDLVISAQAGPREYGVGKGDVFPFLLEVLYDSNQVAGIDRPSLDQAVNFKPFEVRHYTESEFAMDSRVRVYRREYELQFIDGKLDQPYQLPTIVVRYQLNNTNGFAEKAVVPAPIYVRSRLPQDVSDIELQLITDKIQDPSRNRLIAVLWVFGGLLLVGTVVDLAGRVIPRWRERVKQRRGPQSSDALVQAYRSLNPLTAPDGGAALLRQIDHILRLVLADKEKQGWLDEPSLDRVPDEIKPVLTALFGRCQQAYGRNGIGPTDTEQTVQELDRILGFYYGAGEVEAWRN